jgi:unsaturated rhamnogalacturonyl hydrolase
MLYDIHKKEKYKKALDKLYTQLKGQPRTKTGNFWHKKIYPNQIWLDGLYMVQPFYLEYEIKFNNLKNIDDILNQFKNAYTLTRDENTGLFYHGYDETREMFWSDKDTGLSKNFWLRSIGWFGMAMVDTVEKMTGNCDEQEEVLVNYLNEYAESVVKFINKDNKMLYQVPNLPEREGNYLETSGSCAIAYTLMKASRLGLIDEKYFAMGEEILDAVIENKLEVTDEKFVLKDICLVAGLGGMNGKGSYEKRDGTFEYYISEPIVDNDAKGVAPFLFAYAEKLRSKY